MWITEERIENEENEILKYPFSLVIPKGYVNFEMEKEEQICVIRKGRCKAIRLDLNEIALTFIENKSLSVNDYFDYETFKLIFRADDDK